MNRALLASLTIACGARTELSAPEPSDASVDAIVEDVVIVSDAGCTSAAACDDHIACTVDACDPNLHVCTHAPKDSACDDGIFCDGTETCDSNSGCVTTPRDCDDAISCTHDACDESKKMCAHTPDDSLCPISHVCDPVLGCQAHAFAHDDLTLYDVRLPSGQVNVIGSTQFELTDVALSPTNVLWGIAYDELYTVSQQQGTATFVVSTQAASFNGADFAPDGTLWVSGDAELATLNTNDGTVAPVATFPSGTSSSGDVAWVGSRLLATAAAASTDLLVEFDVVNKTSKVLGQTGFTCIWGLAAYGTLLYGLTCDGLILSIDTNSGQATLLVTTTASFWGASAR